jgi:hypothetical protein
MSRLEEAVKPTVGPLLHDISFLLDLSAQTTLALWAVKTAMVIEAITASHRTLCYSRTEREQLRTTFTIPARTDIWVGRYFAQGLATHGTDIGLNLPEIPNVANACATTIIVGHLAIQVLTVHVRPEHSDRAIAAVPQVALRQSLTPIWPTTRAVSWPPPLSFTNSGGSSIGLLIWRWHGGREVSEVFKVD